MINAKIIFKAPSGFSLIDIQLELDDADRPIEILLYENNIGENIIVKRSSNIILSVETYSYRQKVIGKPFRRQWQILLTTFCVSPETLKVTPGANLIIFADFFFSKKSNANVFVPIITDMREEYFEALAQGRKPKARWVRIRGTYSFFAAIGLDRAFAFVSFFIKAWKSVN